MWRSSEGRKIRISRSALCDGSSKERPTAPGRKEGKLEDLSEQEQERLLSLENELLGLDKYMGGDSQYLTAVTYSDATSAPSPSSKPSYPQTTKSPLWTASP